MKVSGRHWDEALRQEIIRRLSVPGMSASRVAAEMGLRKNSVIELARRLREPGSSSEFTPVYQETIKPRHRVPYRKADHDQFTTYEQIHGRKETEKAGVPFAMPEGHVLKGVSALVDGEGKEVLRWVKTREDLATEDLVEALRGAFSEYRAPTIIPPAHADDDLLTVYALPDLHLGMMSWGRETGESYDLAIATQLVRDLVSALVAQSRPSRHALVLGLGDMFHQNDQKNMTPRSGHILDVDGRWPKVLRAGAEIAADAVSLAAAKHDDVLVRFIPGNHDPDAAVALTVALSMFFRNEDRITVDDDPSLHFYHRFGRVLLGATHGHTMKPDRMAMMLAADRPRDWGESDFRHFFFGHIHHESAKEVGGVRVESFGTPAAKDAHAHGGGWRANRSLTAITFHRTQGEIGRHRVNILPPRVAA